MASRRTVPVTTHLPLTQVKDALTSSLIESRARATFRGLQRNFDDEAEQDVSESRFRVIWRKVLLP